MHTCDLFFLTICSFCISQNPLLCSICCVQSSFLFFTKHFSLKFKFSGVRWKVPHHQMFFHAGWTVWWYTIHSRCCEHGTTVKVRLMFSDNSLHPALCWRTGQSLENIDLDLKQHFVNKQFRNHNVSMEWKQKYRAHLQIIATFVHLPSLHFVPNMQATARLNWSLLATEGIWYCHGSLHLTLSHQVLRREESVPLHWQCSGSASQTALLP